MNDIQAKIKELVELAREDRHFSYTKICEAVGEWLRTSAKERDLALGVGNPASATLRNHADEIDPPKLDMDKIAKGLGGKHVPKPK